MANTFAGRYELVDRFGHSEIAPPAAGSGEVWRVWDRKANGYVAARVLRQPEAAPLLRFVREQSFRLRHPHIVTPGGWAGQGDRVLCTMPLVKGGSAALLVREHGQLPSEWVSVVLYQLLDALAEAHKLGIVHGGIRASHLLLEPGGRSRPHLRLSGFGLAAATGAPSEDLSAVGAVAAELLVGMAPGNVSRLTEPSAPLGVPAKLWDVLSLLADAGLAGGATDAATARAELAASGCMPDQWSVVEDTVAVDVFHRMPPYPGGWGPRGPISIAAPAGARRLRLVEPLPPDDLEPSIPEPAPDIPGTSAASWESSGSGPASGSASGAGGSIVPLPIALPDMDVLPEESTPEDPESTAIDFSVREKEIVESTRPSRGARRREKAARVSMPSGISRVFQRAERLRLPAWNLPSWNIRNSRIFGLMRAGVFRVPASRLGHLRLVGVHAVLVGSVFVLAAAILYILK